MSEGMCRITGDFHLAQKAIEERSIDETISQDSTLSVFRIRSDKPILTFRMSDKRHLLDPREEKKIMYGPVLSGFDQSVAIALCGDSGVCENQEILQRKECKMRQEYAGSRNVRKFRSSVCRRLDFDTPEASTSFANKKLLLSCPLPKRKEIGRKVTLRVEYEKLREHDSCQNTIKPSVCRRLFCESPEHSETLEKSKSYAADTSSSSYFLPFYPENDISTMLMELAIDQNGFQMDDKNF
jgi:hypothetical protein